MEKQPESTFLKRVKHPTDIQKKKILSITNDMEMKINTTIKYYLTSENVYHQKFKNEGHILERRSTKGKLCKLSMENIN